MSTCVAKSAKRRIIVISMSLVRAYRHNIRYVLLANSPNKLTTFVAINLGLCIISKHFYMYNFNAKTM